MVGLMSFLTENGVFVVSEKSTIDYLTKHNLIVTSLDEIQGEYVLKLSEDQYNFWLEHSNENLSNSQIFYMKEKSVEELNEEIRKTRESKYKTKSDPLYMAYIKYKAFGDEEKATVALDIWKQAVKEIEEEHPYITE